MIWFLSQNCVAVSVNIVVGDRGGINEQEGFVLPVIQKEFFVHLPRYCRREVKQGFPAKTA